MTQTPEEGTPDAGTSQEPPHEGQAPQPPVHPEPVHPEPVHPEPAHPEPAHHEHHLSEELHKLEDEAYVDSVNWGQTITWIAFAVILIVIAVAGWIWLL